MDRKYNKFSNIDPLDIADILIKIERSFDIELDNESLKSVTTFGKLYDVIIDKIKLEHADTCSTQRAFYLLRNAIANTKGIDKRGITPHTRLSTLFPREQRIKAIQEIEQDLGFEVDLLQPKQWIVVLFAAMLVVSFVALFYNWLIGSAGILASVAGLKLAGKFGKEMQLKTVGELANKLSRESYLKARRDIRVNKNEIEQKVIELFSNDLNLQPVVLRRSAND